MRVFTRVSLAVAVAVAAAGMWAAHGFRRNGIPKHLLGHPIVTLPDFFTEVEAAELMALARGLSPIPPTAREYDSYTPLHDSIGEDHPYNKSAGQLCRPFTIPSADRTRCIFPGRIDVGRHFVLSGGPMALKETYETLVSRVYGFIKYVLKPDFEDVPFAQTLLGSGKFQKLAQDVCPPGKQVLDPIQLNVIAQLPGQTVATHIDAPYFERASRFHHPQWLLAAMVFSGLFQESFIDQVQVVGYFHEWEDDARAGLFKFWATNGEPMAVPPVRRSANAVDGSKVVHAADVYMPEEKPPAMPDSSVNLLRYHAHNSTWNVESDGVVVRSYPEGALRFSVVYRARCFADAEAVSRYHAAQDTPMTQEEIFAVFRRDLIVRGALAPDAPLPPPYDLAQLILTTYVAYPFSHDAPVPVNYCAVGRLVPWAAPLLRPLCG